MVSQATVQAHVNYGLAKAASALGAPNQWYRPTGPSNPISSPYLLGTLQVLYDINANLKQLVPRKRDKPEDWFGGFDATSVKVGDYMVDPTLGTFFITALDFFRPARMALCNRVLLIVRPAPPAKGPGFYGGNVVPTTLMTGWPAAVTQGTKGEAGEVKLPGDTRLPWVSILLPDAGIEIRTGDIITDDQPIPARYTISGTERTSQGWRLTAELGSP